MSSSKRNRAGVLQWAVVLVVGVLVVAVVLGLQLIPRLSAGQKVLNGAAPAFTQPRIAGDQAGIDMISNVVRMSNPIVTARGGGAAEVPALVAYTAKYEHVSPAQALALLKQQFPHTTALLQAIPLAGVTSELPKLVAFLSTTLKLTPAQVGQALKTNFPALDQAITNLPTVTGGWDRIPGIAGLTRFNGAAVTNVPQMRTYFSNDVIPALATQRASFESLNGTSSLNWIAPLLLVVGIVVIMLAVVMILRNRKGVSHREALVSSIVVPVVGVVVVGLVLALSLIPRTSDGQKVLDGLKAPFTQQRVDGARVGINMVSSIVNTADPIMTPAGGAAGEVPKLIAFVSGKTGLPQSAVLAALLNNFPHTTALLQAIPLTAVSAELPGVVALLGPGVVNAIPNLLPTVLVAPTVTSTWNNVPGTAALTRFNGSAVKTTPQVRDYFSSDVVPVLETQRTNFETLAGTSKINFIGPLVLIIGVIVVAFGLLMVGIAWRSRPPGAPSVARGKVGAAA